jgi:hypothetical protein
VRQVLNKNLIEATFMRRIALEKQVARGKTNANEYILVKSGLNEMTVII